MKPCGEWRKLQYNRGYELDVGPLGGSVEHHSPYLLINRKWKAFPEGWYCDGEGFSDELRQKKFKTMVEAMLAAEKEIARLIGLAVREGSRLGFYGRKSVIRKIRQSTRNRKKGQS